MNQIVEVKKPVHGNIKNSTEFERVKIGKDTLKNQNGDEILLTREDLLFLEELLEEKFGRHYLSILPFIDGYMLIYEDDFSNPRNFADSRPGVFQADILRIETLAPAYLTCFNKHIENKKNQSELIKYAEEINKTIMEFYFARVFKTRRRVPQAY